MTRNNIKRPVVRFTIEKIKELKDGEYFDKHYLLYVRRGIMRLENLYMFNCDEKGLEELKKKMIEELR